MTHGPTAEKRTHGLEQWAVIERQFIKEDIKWLNAGAKLISPSGDNISAKKLKELQARLEHVDAALAEHRNPQERSKT